MALSKHEINRLIETLNEAINEKARLNNNMSEELMRDPDFNEDPNYTMPEVDRKKTELYRHGLCGEACDAVKSCLEKNEITIKSIEKIQPNPEHFYLADKNSDLIIDPTYKQFFYRLLVDTNTDELKKNVTAEQVSIIHTMPSIFVGSLVELKAKISETLNKIGKASEENDCLKIWNIPVEKKLTIEEIVSSEKEDLESTSASSDDELQSSPLKKSISLKEKYITQKKEIEKNEENESPKLKL